MNMVGVNGWASALSFCSAPPPSPLPHRVGGAYRTVKRCAVGKARRLTRWGIDPGFINLEGGNPLRDDGKVEGSTGSLGRLGAALIRRRLCGGDMAGLQAHPDDQFLSPSLSRVPLAPSGRGASRSEGERGVSAAIALPPLPLGEGLAKQGVRGRPSTPKLTAPSGLSPLYPGETGTASWPEQRPWGRLAARNETGAAKQRGKGST